MGALNFVNHDVITNLNNGVVELNTRLKKFVQVGFVKVVFFNHLFPKTTLSEVLFNLLIVMVAYIMLLFFLIVALRRSFDTYVIYIHVIISVLF